MTDFLPPHKPPWTDASAARRGRDSKAVDRPGARRPAGIAERCESLLMAFFDRLFQRIPRRCPTTKMRHRFRIVSHRGEYDNLRVYENTMPAFERALAGGVWGLEFDVRWTRDLHPVVIHDPDTGRVFGGDLVIARTCYADLKVSCPMIPALEEVVHRFGRRVHLMVEVKQEHYPAPESQDRILADLFSGLTPQSHYHLISLNPAVLDRFNRLPAQAKMPIARLHVDRMVAQVRRKNYGGLLGHYVLIDNRVLRRCRHMNRPVGTGFVNSKNCLFREFGRGVRWVFSDRAAAMQAVVDRVFTNPGHRA